MKCLQCEKEIPDSKWKFLCYDCWLKEKQEETMTQDNEGEFYMMNGCDNGDVLCWIDFPS